MSGWPVWLASASMFRGGRLLGTADWRDKFDRAYRQLRMVLAGVGDDSRERLFRMNVTLCLHRAATAAEVRGLPDYWRAEPGALAGGPVEVLWAKGVEHAASCLPCESPVKLEAITGRPDLWIPLDCGACGPCRARREAAERAGACVPEGPPPLVA